MARKKVQEIPIMLKLSIFLAKLKKPMIPKLASLKKQRQLKKLKHFKSFNHYSYVKDYEYSPSNTPLIQFYRNKKSERISLRKVRSHFKHIYKCFGLGKGEGTSVLDALSYVCENEMARELTVTRSLTGFEEEEEETVDERAERFIQKFYEEMTRQRWESHSQVKPILDV